MKIRPGCNVKGWNKRFNAFKDYLPRCLWVAGAKRGEWLEPYGEMWKREILEFALSKKYLKKVNSEGQCLSKKSYDQSIGNIKEIEPEILLKLKQPERDRDSAKAITEL